MNKQLRAPVPYCMYIGLLRSSNCNNMQYAPSHTSPFHMHKAAICFFSFSVSFAVLVPVKCRAWKLDVICLWSRTEVLNVARGRETHYVKRLPSGINQPPLSLGGVFHTLESLPVLVELRVSYKHVAYMLFLKKCFGDFSPKITVSFPIE